MSAGTLPAGITLNAATGALAGTPTAGGTANFTIKVTDAAGLTATHATAITILAGALTIAASAGAPTTAPGGTVSYTIVATNTGPSSVTAATVTDDDTSAPSAPSAAEPGLGHNNPFADVVWERLWDRW